MLSLSRIIFKTVLFPAIPGVFQSGVHKHPFPAPCIRFFWKTFSGRRGQVDPVFGWFYHAAVQGHHGSATDLWS